MRLFKECHATSPQIRAILNQECLISDISVQVAGQANRLGIDLALSDVISAICKVRDMTYYNKQTAVGTSWTSKFYKMVNFSSCTKALTLVALALRIWRLTGCVKASANKCEKNGILSRLCSSFGLPNNHLR